MIDAVKRCFLILFFSFGGMVTAQETYALSSESILVITGTSTVNDWEVVAGAIGGSLFADEHSIRDLKIEVPVSGIKSERGPTMDNKMYAALKGENHPKVFFALKEIKENHLFTGTLTIAGVEKESAVNGELVRDTDKIRISGSQNILLQDYGMEPPTAMFGQIVVGETVTVRFDLVFEKK